MAQPQSFFVRNFAFPARKAAEPPAACMSSDSRLGSFGPAQMSCSLRSVKAGTRVTPAFEESRGSGRESLFRLTEKTPCCAT